MADPLLSSLCTICHINVPRYTCPRCSVQTCSLPCVRRHKLWSSCSGTRDPTVYKPRAQLLTPSGIDHDYNFLHSIEHKIERSEKEIIEERGLLGRAELKVSSGDSQRTRHGRPQSRPKQAPGQECIKTMLKMMGTRVHQAPKGMKRNSENGTSWSKNNRQISWQVEWMREAGNQRQLGKLLANKSVGFYYDEWYDEDRRLRMSNDEKREDKKRKASEHKQRVAKRAKTQTNVSLSVSSQLQNPETSAWNVTSPLPSPPKNVVQPFAPESYQRRYNHQLYLLRPLTSSRFPKVLAPIDTTKPLGEVLRRRDVLEFPTIYVFENPIEKLPEDFMLERDFLKATGQGGAVEAEATDSSSDEEEEDDDDDTGSGESEDLEDGEVDG